MNLPDLCCASIVIGAIVALIWFCLSFRNDPVSEEEV